MSATIDSSLPAEVRGAMLEEIKTHLPAFLSRGASEQHDPVGDVSELLNLEATDLKKVIGTHLCLAEEVGAFGDALDAGLRHPLGSSARPPEAGQAVRGPVDWGATLALRAHEPTSPAFVVRSARRQLDVPENRAVAWLLERLRAAARSSLREHVAPELAAELGPSPETWRQRIQRLAAQLEGARRTSWLQRVEPERPTAATIRRLAAARDPFYARHAVAAIEAVRSFESGSPQLLSEALCRRYFEPGPTWLVFEVYVALRLARAFRQASGRPRKARLLAGPDRQPAYARYAFGDGSEVSLYYEAWPVSPEPSALRQLADRHDLRLSRTRPDIVIQRTGPHADAAVIELKASYDSTYLSKGLVKLLGYVGDRGGTWRRPAGWLVAPPSPCFAAASADEEADVWLVSSDEVAAAAVARFAPAG